MSEIQFTKAMSEDLQPVEARYKFKSQEQFEKAQLLRAELARKYPHMKQNRIAKKIVEYFHLEKVK